MTVAVTEQRVSDALEGLRSMLAADGYDLGIALADERLVLEVTATADACADCLVPPATMETIMRGALQRAGVPVDELTLELHHPGAGA
jgi:hypothetical protein